jgi:hypothetical protein
MKSSTLPFQVPEPINEAFKSAGKTVDALSSETKAVARRVEKKVLTAAANVGKSSQAKAAVKLAEDLSGRVAAAVESVVEKGLHRFNVPTRAELKKLGAKVEMLGRKIDALASGRARARRKAR